MKEIIVVFYSNEYRTYGNKSYYDLPKTEVIKAFKQENQHSVIVNIIEL